jgi:hypothetical protein
MYSVYDTLAGGLPHSDIHGSTPARGSPWLFAACHVLHRLLVPRHPPNALLILDTLDVIPKSNVHHAQKPSSEKNKDGPANIHMHNRDFPERPCPRIAHAIRRKIHSAKSFTAPLNPRRRPVPCVARITSFELRRGSDKSAERRDPQSVRRQISNHTRPETHQNLIHISKEQARPPNDDRGATT